MKATLAWPAMGTWLFLWMSSCGGSVDAGFPSLASGGNFGQDGGIGGTGGSMVGGDETGAGGQPEASSDVPVETPPACQPGHMDCDGLQSNGCETSVDSDPKNCRQCTTVCAFSHATAQCVAGLCAIGLCNKEFADCDGLMGNGCEIDLLSDSANCGACGHVCTGTCIQGACSLACTGSMADCDGDVSTGCETNLMTEPDDCAACGHGCAGGACVGAVCQPVSLATGLPGPWCLAIDADSLYWTDRSASGKVVKMPLAGGATTVLADAQNDPDGIAVDDTYVYWANVAGGTIKRIPKGGGSQEILASNQGGPAGVAVGAGQVFWTNWSSGQIMRVQPGSPPILLAAGQANPHRVIVDGATAFWTDFSGDDVRSVPAAGGVMTTIASGQSFPIGITVDALNLYWANAGDGRIMKLPKSGGVPVQLAGAQTHASGIAVDATHVYWADYAVSGAIRKAPIVGGPTTTMVSGLGNPYWVVQDATAVYFTNNSGGTVMKVAK